MSALVQQRLMAAVYSISCSLETQFRTKLMELHIKQRYYADQVEIIKTFRSSEEAQLLHVFCDDLARNAVQGIADLLTGEG